MSSLEIGPHHSGNVVVSGGPEWVKIGFRYLRGLLGNTCQEEARINFLHSTNICMPRKRQLFLHLNRLLPHLGGNLARRNGWLYSLLHTRSQPSSWSLMMEKWRLDLNDLNSSIRDCVFLKLHTHLKPEVIVTKKQEVFHKTFTHSRTG